MAPLSDPAVSPATRPRRVRWAGARRRAALVTSAALLASAAGVAGVAAGTASGSSQGVGVTEAPVPPPPTLVPPVALVSTVDVPAPVDPPEPAEAPAPEPEAAPVEGQPVGSGKASYYGAELAGNPTASGETFDPSELTAAHRTLPFGTRLRVTNERNGRSVVVRVNDRGPFHGNRVIDVSTAAAEEIGLKRAGTARVSLEKLPKKPARG